LVKLKFLEILKIFSNIQKEHTQDGQQKKIKRLRCSSQNGYLEKAFLVIFFKPLLYLAKKLMLNKKNKIFKLKVMESGINKVLGSV